MTEATRNRVYLAIIAALLVVIAALAWKFIVAGSTVKADDGRTAVVLAPGERALLLREMREFVASLQKLSDALARDDMKAVAAASRVIGTAKAHDVPLAMLAKLPLEFKQLAFGVHNGFDAIARDADAAGTPRHALGQLATVLQQCVACHDRYQLSGGAPTR